jgi:hypothetical protein
VSVVEQRKEDEKSKFSLARIELLCLISDVAIQTFLSLFDLCLWLSSDGRRDCRNSSKKCLNIWM